MTDNFSELELYGRLLHDNGLVIGTGGNISLRDGDGFLIKRRGADMSVCGTQGYLRAGRGEEEALSSRMSSEWRLHALCYDSLPDAGALIHTHSPYAVAAAEKAELLEDISYEFDTLLGKIVPVMKFVSPGSHELAEKAAGIMKKGNCALILRRHGVITAGKDLKEAFLRALAVERASLIYVHTRP
jgi:L-fuculose-phosphate aldolase